LNKNFYAVHIAGAREVLSMLYTGEAEAVDDNCRCYDFKDWAELSSIMLENRNGFVNTVTMRVAIPDVIRLARYAKVPRRAVKFSRSNIFSHYKRKCCYCAVVVRSEEATWDHVVPRSKGGSTSWENIVLACKVCNARKADKTPAEAGMTLLVTPSRPEWKGARTVTVAAPAPIPVAWQAFVDRAYWDSELEP
jgi:5-methylcytosine-specific restriction endonuclease McrA